MDIDKLPAWARRALDPNTPMTEARETVRTFSYDGRLFPLIRMVNGKLVDMQDNPGKAYQISIDKGDYIQFDSEEEATAFSKKLSNMIDRKRPMIMQGD